MRTLIDGAALRLHAFAVGDVHWYDSLPVTSEYDDFGQSPPHNSMDRWRSDRLLTSENGLMVVAQRAEYARLGTVGWRSVAWGPSYLSRSLEIGISLVPDARGRGVGTEAQWLLVRYLFAETHVERIQATTDVTNKAEQRALEKVGFTAEGVLRHAQYRRDAYHDLVMYSIVRGDLAR